MKKFIIAILLILVLVGAGAGSYYISYNANKPEEPEPEPEKVFAIYYLDEITESASKLTYYTKKIDTTTDLVTQTTELVNIMQRGHANGYSPFPAYADVISVELVEYTLRINLNEQFFLLQPVSDKLKDIALDCLVNTLIQIDGIHNVEILREGNKIEKFGSKNLEDYLTDTTDAYEISSHKDDALPVYLTRIPYKNKDEKQTFVSLPTTWAAKEVTVKSENSTDEEYSITYSVVGKSTVKTPAMPKSYEETWKIKSDGLYIDEIKYLDKNSYVGNTWDVTNFKPLLNATGSKITEYNATFKIVDVAYKEIDGKYIKEYEISVTVPDLVTKTKATYVENIVLREGQGIYKRNIIDPTSTIHTRLDVDVKE